MENREIEFRAKRYNSKKWIYGSLVDLSPRGKYITIFNVETDKEKAYPVWSETVGQYIGLKDNKRTEEYPEGQKMFEGDRVECRCTEDDLLEDGYKKGNLFFTGIVFYNLDLCVYVLRNGLDIQITSKMDLTIIGTIHDKAVKNAN